MLTTKRPMSLFAVNEAAATFAADRTVAAACQGMDRFVGSFGYVGGAPAAAPTLSFSMNGSDWDSTQPAPAGSNPAPGVTLYTWDLEIGSWAFVMLTVPKPVGSVRGASRLDPLVQN